MTALLTIIHVTICLVLIVAILLQSGKAADLAGAFGGAGSQSVFGARGSQTLLSKVTTICAVLFMITSLGLWLMSGRQSGSVLSGEEAPVTEKAATTTETQKPPAEESQAVETKPPGEKTAEKKPPAKKKSETEKKAPEPVKK